MKKHDFWLKAPIERPDTADIKGYMKTFYRREIAEYRNNVALKRLRRWELVDRQGDRGRNSRSEGKERSSFLRLHIN
ncbi:MAG: hypothetical protein LBV26_05130 [Bacteroidales bacterium]|jgi:hypothetical protein|nr:hypothetical protein [Bacteroidales bacterium]